MNWAEFRTSFLVAALVHRRLTERALDDAFLLPVVDWFGTWCAGGEL